MDTGSKIIKGHLTRFCEALPEVVFPTAETTPPVVFEEETEEIIQVPDFSEAYDEVITAARDEAAAMLRKTRDEAQTVLSGARDESDDIRQKALEAGYSDGLTQGLDEARQRHAEILAAAEADARKAVESFAAKARSEKDALISSLEPRLLRLALDVAGKVLGMKLEENDDAFISIMGNALASVKSDEITLRVSPDDFTKRLSSRESVTVPTPKGNMTVAALSDPDIEPGGIIIDTEGGIIDASPDAQLRRITEELVLL